MDFIVYRVEWNLQFWTFFFIYFCQRNNCREKGLDFIFPIISDVAIVSTLSPTGSKLLQSDSQSKRNARVTYIFFFGLFGAIKVMSHRWLEAWFVLKISYQMFAVLDFLFAQLYFITCVTHLMKRTLCPNIHTLIFYKSNWLT